MIHSFKMKLQMNQKTPCLNPKTDIALVFLLLFSQFVLNICVTLLELLEIVHYCASDRKLYIFL